MYGDIASHLLNMMEPFKNKFDNCSFAYWSRLCHMCDSMVKWTGAHCNCVSI